MSHKQVSTHHRRMISLMLLFMLTLVFLPPAKAQAEIHDLSGVNVAVYVGAGVMSSSYTALTKMFEWMNATAEPVLASQIRDGILDDYDIVVFPGGSEHNYYLDLNTTGMQKIEDFVSAGGSYFGVCGGSTFGANYLQFLNGSMRPVYEPGTTQHLTIMHINRSSTGPDLSGCPENVSLMYWGSQYFEPWAGASIIPIARYDYNGKAGMVAFKHHKGTVFLSSPHPEYEEGSDRDGTAAYDSLNDPDSEWGILFQVAKWLVEASVVESSSSTANSDLPLNIDLLLITIAPIGVAGVVVAGAVFYQRKHK
jgi:glutamine amidotransferase-like uncharacterized protein